MAYHLFFTITLLLTGCYQRNSNDSTSTSDVIVSNTDRQDNSVHVGNNDTIYCTSPDLNIRNMITKYYNLPYNENGVYIGTKSGKIIFNNRISIIQSADPTYRREYKLYQYPNGRVGYRTRLFESSAEIEYTLINDEKYPFVCTYIKEDNKLEINGNKFYVYDVTNNAIIGIKFNNIDTNKYHYPKLIQELTIHDTDFTIKKIFLPSLLKDNMFAYVGQATWQESNGSYRFNFEKTNVSYKYGQDCILTFSSILNKMQIVDTLTYYPLARQDGDIYKLLTNPFNVKYFPINKNERVPNFNN